MAEKEYKGNILDWWTESDEEDLEGIEIDKIEKGKRSLFEIEKEKLEKGDN